MWLPPRCSSRGNRAQEPGRFRAVKADKWRRIIAFIEQPEVIEKILTHLGRWPAQAHGPPESIAA